MRLKPIKARYEMPKAEAAICEAADRVRVARSLWVARQDAESAAELAEAMAAFVRLRDTP